MMKLPLLPGPHYIRVKHYAPVGTGDYVLTLESSEMYDKQADDLILSKTKAYFHAEPLSVCLTGAREWAPMYPFVQSVRLVDALYEYRKNGLPLLQFLNCKNYALNNFIPDFVLMLKNKQKQPVKKMKNDYN